MTGFGHLMAPGRIGAMSVRNRLVMSPMETMYGTPDGLPSQRTRDYFAARARGGVGLITLGATGVDHHPETPGGLHLSTDDAVAAHRALVEAVHEHGAKIQPQIVHAGPDGLGPELFGVESLGPSVIPSYLTGRPSAEISARQLTQVFDLFKAAARRDVEAGYDGIELHAAHGYMLLGSFLAPQRNRRTDEYRGDSARGRARVVLDALAAIRSEIALELAEFLAGRGRLVAILEAGKDIAQEAGNKRKTEHMDRLDRLGVTVHVRAVTERITADAVEFTPDGGTIRRLAADSVVLAGTVEPDTALFDALVDALPDAEVHAAGDCTGLGLIRKPPRKARVPRAQSSDRRTGMTETEQSQASPALTASQSSWRCVQAHDREGWLALMSDDVVIEDPIGKSVTNPDGTGVRGKEAVGAFFDTNIAANQLSITCEETFPSSSPDEIAHILVLNSKFDGGLTSSVRGVFTYKVNDAGLITNMRGYWNLDMMQFGKQD